VDPRAILRPEWLLHSNIPMTLSGIKPRPSGCTLNVNYFIYEELRLFYYYFEVALNTSHKSAQTEPLKMKAKFPYTSSVSMWDSCSLNNIFCAHTVYVSFLHGFVEKINFPQGQTVTFVIVGSDVANCDSSVSDRWGTSNMFQKFPALRRKCMFMEL